MTDTLPKDIFFNIIYFVLTALTVFSPKLSIITAPLCFILFYFYYGRPVLFKSQTFNVFALVFVILLFINFLGGAGLDSFEKSARVFLFSAISFLFVKLCIADIDVRNIIFQALIVSFFASSLLYIYELYIYNLEFVGPSTYYLQSFMISSISPILVIYFYYIKKYYLSLFLFISSSTFSFFINTQAPILINFILISSFIIYINFPKLIFISFFLKLLLALFAPFIIGALYKYSFFCSYLFFYIEDNLSLLHRIFIWGHAYELFLERPFLGWGWEEARRLPNFSDIVSQSPCFDYAYGYDLMPLHPHNSLMNIWLELGAAGALVISGFLTYVFYRICKIYKNNLRGRAVVLATFTSIFAGSLVSFGLWQDWYICSIGFIASIAVAFFPPQPVVKNPA